MTKAMFFLRPMYASSAQERTRMFYRSIAKAMIDMTVELAEPERKGGKPSKNKKVT